MSDWQLIAADHALEGGKKCRTAGWGMTTLPMLHPVVLEQARETLFVSREEASQRTLHQLSGDEVDHRQRCDYAQVGRSWLVEFKQSGGPRYKWQGQCDDERADREDDECRCRPASLFHRQHGADGHNQQ